MKILAATLLFCAMMALTRAAVVPEADPGKEAQPLVEEAVPEAAEADPGEEAEPVEEDVVAGESKLVRTFKSCPFGWTHYNGRCFRYIPVSMTWANAEKNCQLRGGNLASVRNLGEYYAIQSMILKLTHTRPLTWLGGSDAEQEGTWFWSDGTPFLFKYWSSGQPDNYGSADCLLMNFGGHLKFDDQPCWYSKPFVCAIKL